MSESLFVTHGIQLKDNQNKYISYIDAMYNTI